ncbi:MAG: HD domain-containing protein [Deltaproteobacteria bacterium]|nr:HD domain-containing protein [Deltaproteobacteria bacterium]
MKSYFFEGIDKDKDLINKQDNDGDYSTILTEWASHFLELKQKGLIPLFITGAGVSMDVETNKGQKIPDIYKIIETLENKYNQKPSCQTGKLAELFQTLNELKRKDKKDRGTVARLLDIFQEKEDLEGIWKDFNEELIDIIIDTKRSPFHEKLADVHRNYGAVTLTLNFDGLLIREFEKYGDYEKEKAFSLPKPEECESFFLRLRNDKSSLKEYLEIQIRGDIFYITCDADGFCPQKGQPHSLWAFIASYHRDSKHGEYEKYDKTFFLKCPACGKPGKSFLSFPGSYKKEKSMREMLEIVWKHLSFRIGSVTVAGCSCEWDPLLIAFLGDLLTERDIPLLVIDKEPQRNGKYKYIIEELVKSNIHDAKALGVSAKEFIEDLTIELNRQSQSLTYGREPKYDLDPLSNDNFWHDKFNREFQIISKNINYLSQVEIDLLSELKGNKLHKISQLGLKSRWLGIDEGSHTRYHHSLGVMKIASYLYDAITKKENIGNPYERQFLRIAAVMHDIGHLPFSHLIESVFNELNWKPADYKEYYSHEFQTEKQIDKIFSKSNYENQLNNIGYSRKDLKRLINGCFGVGYLDAIINSPIDSDKIDYVFRDTQYTGRKIFLDSVQFLKDITDGLEITPEKHLSFLGISAVAAAQLLEARRHLYEHLYLQPGIVILEGIVKLIIKTYFVHSIDMGDNDIIESMKNENDLIDYPDLGEYKINYCINNKLLSVMINKDLDEMGIINFMYNEICDIEYISDSFKESLKESFSLIERTTDNGAINEFEKQIIHRRIKYQKDNKDNISEIIKDVSFRFPGAAIIEAVKQPDFLSSANSRKKRERSDGTTTFAECTIVPKGDYHSWNPTDIAAKSIHDSSLNEKKDEVIIVYIYPMLGTSDDTYFKQAVNLFDKIVEKNSIMVIDNDRKNSQYKE